MSDEENGSESGANGLSLLMRLRRRGLDYKDPTQMREWLADVAAHIDEVIDVAEDTLKPVRERTMGRRTHRELIAETKAVLKASLEYAVRGLPPPPSMNGATR